MIGSGLLHSPTPMTAVVFVAAVIGLYTHENGPSMARNTRKPLTEEETRFSALVGHNVRLRRKKLRMSADTLAERSRAFKVPVNRDSLYRMESGEAVAISVDRLVVFAHVLGCTVIDLLADQQTAGGME